MRRAWRGLSQESATAFLHIHRTTNSGFVASAERSQDHSLSFEVGHIAEL